MKHLIIFWSPPSPWPSSSSTTWHGTYHFMYTHFAQWLVPRFHQLSKIKLELSIFPFLELMTTYLQRFSIKFFWIYVACPSILPCVKDIDKFHKPKMVAIAPLTYVLRVWIWKLTHMLR
jgi:hypothetical protein